MALTGLIWYGFLVGHLVGNLLLLAGDGGAAFELYADFLEAATQFVVPTEVILLLALAVHIYCAVTLSREASAARPVAYRRLRAVGSRSLASVDFDKRSSRAGHHRARPWWVVVS